MTKIDINISFLDTKVHGTDYEKCLVHVIEQAPIGFNNNCVSTYIEFNSWETMKERYPNLISLLEYISINSIWEKYYSKEEHELSVSNVFGYNGLYEFNENESYFCIF